MLYVIIVFIILGAAAAAVQLWLPLPGLSASLDRAVNAVLGAAVGAALTLPLWWWLKRRAGLQGDGLRRWWQATLLGLVGALCAGALTAGWVMLFGVRPVWLAVGGLLVLWMTVLGLALGAGGPMDWRSLWARPSAASTAGRIKLLDTSVIIDGRINDLVKTGFIEGKLVLTHFVLQELHAVADSSEPLRRRKGRRGLDILGDLQLNPLIELETIEDDVAQHRDVDHKLIELAKRLQADLLTTDYNLNKVAKVEGVRVLNINELANAVKPRFLPGEPLTVEVIGRGEEIGQGIGYLDDGTMVVVENGREYIGKAVDVVVSSTLQTDAGKMLFVRLKHEQRHRSHS